MDALARLPSGMNITGKKQRERVGALFLCFWRVLPEIGCLIYLDTTVAIMGLDKVCGVR